ncbi:signal peptide peptidase SppA [Roseomonas sp. NAR14]|uniref:Signal peptide peptidase SppA n=1 Tax=Roseomonas acroporae TaxID=2937791 RepID=A0A9X1Y7W5_9PROT|nr:signal peptide peptidase SppA [Roseomonas acroporae]MCK8785178.1 signal peptide peptidase SppA [Roseomonas acroporae]
MTLQADALIDRRRLKRRLTLWRGGAVLLAVALLALLVGRAAGVGTGGLGGAHIARLTVSGFIAEDREVLEALEKAGRNPAVRALIVSINSPGGSVGGGEALHAALVRLRESKPVVAVLRGTAASAAYMTAVATDRIIARESTVTGSIGVLLQSFDVSELLGRIGVRPEILTSGPLKAVPNPFRPLDEAGRAALERIVADLHAQFVAMVAAGRHMPEDRVRPLADGRIFTGRQALAAGLVDSIGGEAEARRWLESERHLPAGLPIRDLSTGTGIGRSLGLALGPFLGSLLKSVVSEWLGVDGFMSVWQPSA